jgi:5-carboxymethyl-2-hydroxymuconate isomerase
VPHIHIEYSSNLEERLDITGLLVVLRDAALETGLFPLAGIRVRATPARHVLIADGNPDHAFLDISLRLRGGRELDVRKKATDEIYGKVRAYCAETLETSSFLLSFEMRNIDPDLAPKDSSVARYLND